MKFYVYPDHSPFNDLGLKKGDTLILNEYRKPKGVNFAGSPPEDAYFSKVTVEKEYPDYIMVRIDAKYGSFFSSIHKGDIACGKIHVRDISPRETAYNWGPSYCERHGFKDRSKGAHIGGRKSNYMEGVYV